MTTDFRAMCARMADELDHYRQLVMDDRRETHALAAEARAALAQPEPEGPAPPGPSDEDLDACADEFLDWNPEGIRAFARAVLARWGPPNSAETRRPLGDAPQSIPVLPEGTQVIEPTEHTLLVPVAHPIPVSERLPGPGDCDAEGECYWFDPEGSGAWYQDTWQGNYSHWLPAHALPVPGEVEV